MSREIISFDWALKYTLRDKANFDLLGGLFSSVLGREVKVEDLLESEGNKDYEDSKLIRLDIKARLDNRELAIIELQYKPEHHVFSRLLFYASKTLVEHVKIGSDYETLPKIYVICICNFSLGSSREHAYHGQHKFTGIYSKQELELSPGDQRKLSLRLTDDVFPEYFIFSLTKFDGEAGDALGEWLYAIKTGKVQPSFRAPGIQQAATRLDLLQMDAQERERYEEFQYNQRIEKNQELGLVSEAEARGEARGKLIGEARGKELGQAQAQQKIIKDLLAKLAPEQIADLLGMDVEQVKLIAQA